MKILHCSSAYLMSEHEQGRQSDCIRPEWNKAPISIVANECVYPVSPQNVCCEKERPKWGDMVLFNAEWNLWSKPAQPANSPFTWLSDLSSKQEHLCCLSNVCYKWQTSTFSQSCVSIWHDQIIGKFKQDFKKWVASPNVSYHISEVCLCYS